MRSTTAHPRPATHTAVDIAERIKPDSLGVGNSQRYGNQEQFVSFFDELAGRYEKQSTNIHVVEHHAFRQGVSAASSILTTQVRCDKKVASFVLVGQGLNSD